MRLFRRFSLIPRRFAVSAATIAVLALPALAAAAEPTPTELAVARRLFDEAVQLERNGEWQLAAVKLRDALEVKDTPGLRFHLAHCEEKLGLLVEALLDYRRASDLIDAGSKAPDVQRLLGPARAALERRVPQLVVIAPADIEGLEVELDGKVLPRSVVGRPAPINPGTHRVLVRAPDYEEFVANVNLTEGERQSLDVVLRRSPVIPAPAAEVRARRAEPEPAAEPRREAGTSARTYVLVGESTLSLAALGVGIAYFIVADSSRERVIRAREATRQESNGSTACASRDPSERVQRLCAAFADAVSDYDRARWISTAGFITAGAGAAAAVLTFALWPEPTARPKLKASASATGVSFSMSGAF